MLQLVFSRMLSDAGLFPNIGDPNRESHDLPPLKGYVPDAQRMSDVGIRPNRPTTAPRAAYECVLFHEAVLFLLGHEIAHITRGHVDYLASKSGASLISEMEFNGDDEEAIIERQAIEADADRRSVWSSVASIELTLATPNLRRPPWLPSGQRGLSDLIFDWAFPMNSLFRLFGDKRFNPADLETNAYPPLPLRRMMATSTAYVGLVFNAEPGRKYIVMPAKARVEICRTCIRESTW